MRKIGGAIVDVSIVSSLSPRPRFDLVQEFLRLRRIVFLDRMGWDLDSDGAVECEQYDCIGVATYVIAVHDGSVVGGARLVRCDNQMGSGSVVYSYMIRDAYRGLINIPPAICKEEPPSDRLSWELSRFLSTLPGRSVGRKILDATNAFLVSLGARECLFLADPAFMRMARIYGYVPVPLGEVVSDKSGQYLAFKCGVRK